MPFAEEELRVHVSAFSFLLIQRRLFFLMQFYPYLTNDVKRATPKRGLVFRIDFRLRRCFERFKRRFEGALLLGQDERYGR
ncbi:hypothetical protein C0075_03520 [Rhizobium sp. KAs_5_22]|nr:hypothetical protein C0075_03520 [Rhizobium sp. KAs_5_22]